AVEAEEPTTTSSTSRATNSRGRCGRMDSSRTPEAPLPPAPAPLPAPAPEPPPAAGLCAAWGVTPLVVIAHRLSPPSRRIQTGYRLVIDHGAAPVRSEREFVPCDADRERLVGADALGCLGRRPAGAHLVALLAFGERVPGDGGYGAVARLDGPVMGDASVGVLGGLVHCVHDPAGLRDDLDDQQGVRGRGQI